MKDNGNRSSENTRKKLEALRSKLISKFGEKGFKRIMILVPVCLLILVALTVLSFLLPIRSFTVEGELDLFNEGEIISSSGLRLGDSIFWKTGGSIERKIKKDLPLCDSVEVKKSLLSGNVKISIGFSDVDYYCKIGDIYCALDDELRVMDINRSGAKYTANGAVRIALPDVRSPKLGEILVFYDTVEETDTEGETLYEVKKERFYSYVSEFLSALKESELIEDVKAISLTERFDIRMNYADKYMVRFGSAEKISAKLAIFEEILNEGSMEYAEKVTVDLSDPTYASARADDSIDFDSLFE